MARRRTQPHPTYHGKVGDALFSRPLGLRLGLSRTVVIEPAYNQMPIDRYKTHNRADTDKFRRSLGTRCCSLGPGRESSRTQDRLTISRKLHFAAYCMRSRQLLALTDRSRRCTIPSAGRGSSRR